MSQSPDSPSGDAGGLEPGWLVGGGRFTLIRVLGRGGMGVVWLAQDEQLRERVGLKFLPPEVQFDAAALHRLRRETARTRRLTHPNIVRIHDLFHEPGREAFISMEWVDGPNLADARLQESGQVFMWETLVPLVAQLCAALNYAHAEGIIHRDIKPANLMLDARGRLKLADFGLAGTLDEAFSRTSARGAGAGTMGYMSPQQLDGAPPAVADDIYSLGVSLYELLTGRPPFYSGDIPNQIRTVAPRPLSEQLAASGLAHEIPAQASLLVMSCLAKDPGARPSSAQAVSDWASGADTIVVPRAVNTETEGAPLARRAVPVEQIQRAWQEKAEASPAPAAVAPSPAVTAPSTKHEAPARSTKFAAAMLGVGLLAGIGLVALIAGGFWLFKSGGFSRPTASSGGGVSEPVVPPSAAVPTSAPTPAVVGSTRPPTPVPAVPDPEPKVIPATPPGRPFQLFLPGEVPIRDGLDSWRGDRTVWSAQSGELRGVLASGPNRRTSVLTWPAVLPADVELAFSVRQESGTAAAYYRVQALDAGDFTGLQFKLPPAPAGGLGARASARGWQGFPQAMEDSIFKPGEWNHVLIRVRGDRVLHQLNGVFVVQEQHHTLTKPAGGIAFELASGRGEPPARLAVKDIRYRAIAPTEPFPPPGTLLPQEFSLLQTGRDLNGWTPVGSGTWRASQGGFETGYAGGATDRPPAFLAWAGRQAGDFELRFRFRRAGGHAAVMYLARATAGDSVAYRGVSFGISENHLGSILEDVSGPQEKILAAGLAHTPSPRAVLTHDGRIAVQRGTIRHYVDGRLVATAPVPSGAASPGYIALRAGYAPGQNWSSCHFRMIQLLSLSAP